MDLNKGNTISFIRRHRLFLGALLLAFSTASSYLPFLRPTMLILA